ncbi:MAG: DUF2225 domain-containing protein [Defluviitaleaceae bacterium]|nr:DUF2225 domain-containing protein [Defluviitaleaceae bacterium]
MDINALKNSSFAKQFSANSLIAAEGDKSGDAMYIVVEGSVDVFKDYQKPSEKKLATLKPGNFFGESTLFLQREYVTSEVAAEDSVVLEVTRASVKEFLETNPELTFLVIKTLCQRLESRAGVAPPADATSGGSPASPDAQPATPPQSPDEPPPGSVEVTVEGLFPPGHKLYTYEAPPTDPALIYKKAFACPVCDNNFQAWAVRTTKLKVEHRDKDFRNHVNGIQSHYYDIVTCPACYYSMFSEMYAKPIISRFKENIPQITELKAQFGGDMVEDRNINNVFAGYYLALKGAPLFYKDHEMNSAKIWRSLKWLYEDVGDRQMAEIALKNAQKGYLAAFEKTDAMPDVLQQLCVLVAELSIMVKDFPNAKIFFVKARSYRNGSKAMISQAEDGIELLRKIESGQVRI